MAVIAATTWAGRAMHNAAMSTTVEQDHTKLLVRIVAVLGKLQ